MKFRFNGSVGYVMHMHNRRSRVQFPAWALGKVFIFIKKRTLTWSKPYPTQGKTRISQFPTFRFSEYPNVQNSDFPMIRISEKFLLDRMAFEITKCRKSTWKLMNFWFYGSVGYALLKLNRRWQVLIPALALGRVFIFIRNRTLTWSNPYAHTGIRTRALGFCIGKGPLTWS